MPSLSAEGSAVYPSHRVHLLQCNLSDTSGASRTTHSLGTFGFCPAKTPAGRLRPPSCACPKTTCRSSVVSALALRPGAWSHLCWVECHSNACIVPRELLSNYGICVFFGPCLLYSVLACWSCQGRPVLPTARPPSPTLSSHVFLQGC